MASLFQELQRRKVFRVAAAYAVVGWVLAQVAAFAVETFAAPQWVQQIFVVFLILGFPLAMVLAWAYEVTPNGISVESATQSSHAASNSTDRNLIYLILVLVVLGVGFQFSDRFFSDDANSAIRSAGSGSGSASPTVVRSSIILNQSLPPLPGFRMRTILSLAPDGSTLAYSDWQNGSLLLRDLATQETHRFEVGFAYPVFSPDSQNILVFLSNARDPYSIMPAQGGVLRPLPIEVDVRATWLTDEEIVYQHTDGGFRIFSLEDETDEVLPGFVAQEESGIFLSLHQRAAFFFEKSPAIRQQNQFDIQIYDHDSRSATMITNNGYHAQYADSGHVVFVRRGDLWAVPFDLDTLKVTGPEARIVEGVDSQPNLGLAAYSMSDSGRLVYLLGPEYFPDQTVFVWTDRSGRQEEIPLPAGNYGEPRISPDGEYLALTSRQGDGSSDIWFYDFSTGSFGPRTFSGNALNPVWAADGSRLFYQVTSALNINRQSRGELWVVNADGTGQAERILDASARITSFSESDGKLIYVSYNGTGFGGQLNTLTFSDDAWVSAPLLHTDFNTNDATVSPDGRWIVYNSNESGANQIYVRPYPNLDGGKWQISSGSEELLGNIEPAWGPNSDELFFLRSDGTLMHTDVSIEGDSFSPGIVEPLLTDLQVDYITTHHYSVFNDGERFLHIKAIVDEPDARLNQNYTELVIIENFFEELRRLAPPDPQ